MRIGLSRLAAILFLAAGAVVFLLHAVDTNSIEVAWGFFLTSCGFIVERLD